MSGVVIWWTFSFLRSHNGGKQSDYHLRSKSLNFPIRRRNIMKTLSLRKILRLCSGLKSWSHLQNSDIIEIKTPTQTSTNLRKRTASQNNNITASKKSKLSVRTFTVQLPQRRLQREIWLRCVV